MRLRLSSILRNLLRLHAKFNQNSPHRHVPLHNITLLHPLPLHPSLRHRPQQRVVHSPLKTNTKEILVCQETSLADELPLLIAWKKASDIRVMLTDLDKDYTKEEDRFKEVQQTIGKI